MKRNNFYQIFICLLLSFNTAMTQGVMDAKDTQKKADFDISWISNEKVFAVNKEEGTRHFYPLFHQSSHESQMTAIMSLGLRRARL